MRKFTNSATGKKQKDASAQSKAQRGGRPNEKQKTNSNTNSGFMLQQQVIKIVADVAKLGKKEVKETSKFDKGMQKISALLVNSATPAQVGGVEGEVNNLSDADKRKEKMTEVAVVLKIFMRKRGKRSNKNNRDADEE